MNKYKPLTKKMLTEEYRIQNIFYHSISKEWVILRDPATGSGYQPQRAAKATPNGNNLAVSLYVNGKYVRLDLARIVYVWFFEDLTEEDAVVFIDGDRHNLAMTNLRKVTREEARAYENRSKKEAQAEGEANLENLKGIGVGYEPIRRVKYPQKARRRKK